MDSTDFPNDDLAAEVVRSFGALRLRVTGSSMLPAIRPGDVLWISRCGLAEADLGDIVLYTRHRRLFVHRIVARSGAHLVTQGDAITDPDPPVNGAELLGKVVRIQRRGRPIRIRSQLKLPGRAVAALIRRSPLAGRLFTRLHHLQHRAGL